MTMEVPLSWLPAAWVSFSWDQAMAVPSPAPAWSYRHTENALCLFILSFVSAL